MRVRLKKWEVDLCCKTVVIRDKTVVIREQRAERAGGAKGREQRVERIRE